MKPLLRLLFPAISIFLICSCATYRPHYIEFSSMKGDLIRDNIDSVSVWAYPIHPDTSDKLFDYGNWFLGYNPPKGLDNILHKGYQPYYINIKNNATTSLTFNSQDQPLFRTGKHFHRKTRIKHWMFFGVSAGASALLAIIQPDFFLPFFGTLFVGYTVPNLFYNLALNNKRKSFIQNLSPEMLTIPSGKTDSLLVFAKVSENPIDLYLKSSTGKPISISVKPSNYRSRFFKFNGLNAMVMREGDSLKEIGQKLDIAPEFLLAFNDLNYDSKIAIGDTFYIEPKKKYATEKSHMTSNGDNVFKVSQKYGISKETILKLNPSITSDSLVSGQVVKLNRKK